MARSKINCTDLSSAFFIFSAGFIVHDLLAEGRAVYLDREGTVLDGF